jgi:hypothetical protein
MNIRCSFFAKIKPSAGPAINPHSLPTQFKNLRIYELMERIPCFLKKECSPPRSDRALREFSRLNLNAQRVPAQTFSRRARSTRGVYVLNQMLLQNYLIIPCAPLQKAGYPPRARSRKLTRGQAISRGHAAGSCPAATTSKQPGWALPIRALGITVLP